MNQAPEERWIVPSGWEWTRLSQLGDIVAGGTPSTKEPTYWGNDIHWISPADLTGYTSKTIKRGAKSISKSGLANSSAKVMPSGSVHFSSRAPIGYVVISSEPLATNQGFKSLVPAPGIFNKYIYYYLIASQDYARKCASGTTFLELSGKAFGNLSIPIAPTVLQYKIVAKIEELFSELDKGVESLKKARAQLNIYRQAVLKHAFEGKLTAKWREENKDKLETIEQLINRNPVPVQPRGGRTASTQVIEGVAAMAVNIPSKAPPPGWSWVPLLRIARQETGHTPSRSHVEYWNGDQDWIGIADARLHHGKEIKDTIQKVTRKGLDNSSARTLPVRTVCLSRTASIGYVCIMSRPMATSQDFATWTCTGALEPKFLMYALMAEGNEIKRFGKGTTHTTIYFPEIRAMTICLPPLEEQCAIINAVEAKLDQLDVLATEIDSRLVQCDVLRQSVLKKAFAGQLVEQNPHDEPASILLGRIKAEREKAKRKRKSAA